MTYDYVAPASVEEAVGLLVERGEEAHLIAGGASLLLMLRQQLVAPSMLIGLRNIDSLRGVAATDAGGLRIGATTTHRQVERSPEARSYAPALVDAFGQVATVRIRNQGTVGGNLAHADPAQDPPTILMALDATVHATGPDGSREIPIAEFFVDYFETVLEPSEILTAVSLPPRPSEAEALYVKYLPGSQDDYATVAVAVSGVPGDGWADLRIACGAAGPTPMRIRAAEAVVEGSDLGADVVRRAAELVAETVDPIDDIRGSADYKREMAKVWTRRALERLAQRSGSRSAGAG